MQKLKRPCKICSKKFEPKTRYTRLCQNCWIKSRRYGSSSTERLPWSIKR